MRVLVREQTIAALGTLHEGEPYFSMVPYALPANGADFSIHVSRLAGHTKDMLASARVSMLIVAHSGDSPQCRARVTVQGDAHPLVTGSAEYAAAKACYLARFPHTAEIFELADFSIFRIALAASCEELAVVQVAIARNMTLEQANWGALFASASSAVLVALVPFLFLQRYYIRVGATQAER